MGFPSTAIEIRFMSNQAVESKLSSPVIASARQLSDVKFNKPKPLHRSLFRLIPYTAFGAFLISLKSAPDLNSIVTIYAGLMIAQISIAGIYLLTSKLSSKKTWVSYRNSRN